MPDRAELRPGALLTIGQARELLPLSRASLYRLAATGRLEAVRVPCAGREGRSGRSRLLFVRASIEEYVASARLGPPTPDPETVDGILARVISASQEPLTPPDVPAIQ